MVQKESVLRFVLLFTFLVSMIVGAVFGLIPAFSSKQVELVPALKEGASGLAGASHGGRSVVGSAVVVIQMALAMLVLTGAGLLVRTFGNLKAVNPGFDPQNLLVFSLDTTYSNRTGANQELLYHEPLFAGYIPSRRAMKTDPMVALRYE